MKRRLISLAIMLRAFLPGSAQLAYEHTSWQLKTPAPDTMSMMIIGDVMMHVEQLDFNHREFLSHIAPQMRKADICVANMEFSLGGKPYSGYPCFCAPDDYAEYLVGDCGLDVMLTANNHILDRGEAGLRRTLAQYRTLGEKYGAKYTGAAADSCDAASNNPLLIDCKGIRLALVNFTYGTNAGSNVQWPAVNLMCKRELSVAIARAREQKADFIIALPHWGTEYTLEHNADQEKWAEWLASRGVDAIVGTHPHVVQDTCHIGSVPVIYSIGNAVSNMSQINTRLELCVTLKFVNDLNSCTKKMLEPQLQFMWCSLPGRLCRNYSTIFVKEYLHRSSEWLSPSDYYNMTATWTRVKAATGIKD